MDQKPMIRVVLDDDEWEYIQELIHLKVYGDDEERVEADRLLGEFFRKYMFQVH